MPNSEDQIENLFIAALDLASDERNSFLEAQCDGNDDLKEKVLKLLRSDEDAQSEEFLERSAIEIEAKNFSENLPDSRLGQRIGNYKISEKISSGGMGTIYLAIRSDGQFEKKVALKLIKRGMDSEAILQRFLLERQILANLEHTYIARLLDAGMTDDGLPFFVMEYVEGVPINEYCESNDLNLNSRLQIFRKVCAAVSFAHQKLVIHRDLKPSNILVANDETPKLLDFGIAKLLNSTDDATRTEARVLTPAYASPEQMRGEIVGTSSDVFSLGVILEELLTDKKLSSTDAAERWRSANDETRSEKRTDPNSGLPTVNTRLLPGDLQIIVSTAKHIDAERRYHSVEQFAEDIRRYLENLPISARKDSVSYRVTKFVKRNRLTVAVAALFVLSLIGGLLATIWQFRQAQAERARAERRFSDVRALTNSFMFEFHDAIENLPGSTPARELVVKRAVEYLDKLSQESGGDALLERELATAYERIGRIQGNSYYSNLGDTDGALKSYRTSLEIRQRLAALEPDNEKLQTELANSYEGVGDMLYTINDLQGGLHNYENVLQIRQRSVDENDLESRSALADIYSKIGDIKGLDGYQNLGDTDGALAAYNTAAEIDGEISNAAPDNESYQYQYAQRLENLGNLRGATGKTADAIDVEEKADKIFSALALHNPNNTNYQLAKLSNLISLRWVLSDADRHAEAVEKAREAIAKLEQMRLADPKDTFVPRSLGVSYNALGRSLFLAGDINAALENHRHALQIADGLLAADQSSSEKKQDVVHSLQYLAEAQMANAELAPGLANYRRAVSLLEELYAIDATDVRTTDDLSISNAGIGNTLAAMGNYQAALENLQRSVSFAEATAQRSPSNVRIKSRLALRYFEIGEVYSKMRQTDLMQNWYRKSFEVWNQIKQTGTLNKLDAKRLAIVSAALK